MIWQWSDLAVLFGKGQPHDLAVLYWNRLTVYLSMYYFTCEDCMLQDKNVWLSVIDMLKKQDRLPVVAFTFSKKKIDENAHNLGSLDLTTAKEKSEIHIFFHNSIRRLKGLDQELPQVWLPWFHNVERRKV